MSSSAAASSYWRVAGMTYLKYADLCSNMLRASLREPLRAKARAREAIYYRSAQWEGGAPRAAEVVDLVDAEVEAAAKAKR
jgi:F-type H+-transporting ATPase subunit epsilon